MLTASPRVDKREQDRGRLSRGELTLSGREQELKGTRRSEKERELLLLLFTSAALPLFILGSQSGPACPALHPVSWGAFFLPPQQT